jgi:hypothetical protein
MALIFNFNDEDYIQLNDFVDHVAGVLNPNDRDSLINLAPTLSALGRNKNFVLESVHSDLKKNIESFQSTNRYTDQSLILAVHDIFTIRLNIWSPPVSYGGDITLDEKRRSYNLPHNHNFDLLTVGYWGPGYITEMYSFDAKNAVGFVGEKISIEHKGITQLKQNCVMFYETSTDVHTQISPTELSMSLNVIPSNKKSINIDQFEFDIEKSTISAYVGSNVSNRATFLYMASLIGDENTLQILLDISKKHINPRIRAQAINAAAKITKGNIDDIWEIAMRDKHELVRMQVRKN